MVALRRLVDRFRFRRVRHPLLHAAGCFDAIAAEAEQHARRRGPLDRRAAIDLDKILSIRPNEKSGRAAAVGHLLLRRKQRIVARTLFNILAV